MEFVLFPTAWIAELTVGIVKHAIAFELIVWVELSLILGPIWENMLAVGFIGEVLECKVVDWLFGWVYGLYLANGCTFGLVRLVEHINWGLEFPQFEFIRQAALVVEAKTWPWSLANLVHDTALLHNQTLDRLIHNLIVN